MTLSRRRRTYGQLPNHTLQESGRNGEYVYIYFCMPLWIQIPANTRGVACSSIFYLLVPIMKFNNPSFYVRATPVDFSGARVLRSYTKLFLPRNPLQSEILIINSDWFRVFELVFTRVLWVKLPFPTPRRPTPCRAGSSPIPQNAGNILGKCSTISL